MTGVLALTDRACWDDLGAALRPWVVEQRWFGGKARTMTSLAVDEVIALGGDVVALVLLDVRYDDGRDDRYQVPLSLGAEPVARVGGLALGDATDDPDAVRVLAEATLQARAEGPPGAVRVEGVPVGDPPQLDLRRSRKLGVEQSNTSVVIDDALMLKVFRRLERGANPDVELTAALTAAGFRNVPAQAGSLRLVDDDEPTYLAVASAFLGGAREGWDLAVEEAVAVRDGAEPGRLLATVDALGAVVARMHLVLRDALGAEEASFDDADGWSRSMETQARRVLDLAAARAPEAAATVLARREEIIRAFTGLAELGDLGVLVRAHGDLHLGQVLIDDADGWQLLDFEGEPARPLAERRLRQPPLRDVAGVLRSFDYAAATAAIDPPPALAAWRDALRAAFLAGYRPLAAAENLVPAESWDGLLAAFELDKAVYELGYELENRPHWVAIPAAGILRVLDAAT